MSVRYRCALCGKTTKKALLDNHVCKACHKAYDTQADWVQELIKAEKQWHKSQNTNASIVNFSRLHTQQNNHHYDGEDMINGEVEFPYMRRGRIPKSKKITKIQPHPVTYLDKLEIVLEWGDVAELSNNEKKALEIIVLFMQEQTISLEGASQILSEIEGEEITPIEFRDRLNQARQKLIDAGITL